MPRRKKHPPEEIVGKLRQVEVATAQATPVADAIRAIGVTEATYYRWRREFGGLKLDQVKRLKELERENARLRGLLEGERSFYEYGPLARVVAPVSDQFTNRIQIDVGSEDGIKSQMPVVIGDNTLIGRTTDDVSRSTAQVMLVTDREFRAGVRIIPPAEFDPSSGQLSPAITAPNVSYGEGLLGTNLEGYFGVDYVDLSSRAEKGDYVVTSGRAGNRQLLFPPGLFVGTIESVSSQDIDQYKKIVVEPAMDADDLEEVRVITDWGPGPGVPG
jgi:rod shape-determining protein MreC